MGYRLEISKIKYAHCAGKLFGYTDECNLKSYKWLLENEYIDGDEIWDYGFNPHIVLNSVEFEEFIKLYYEDLNEYYKDYNFEIDDDLQELINSKCDKLLEWW